MPNTYDPVGCKHMKGFKTSFENFGGGSGRTEEMGYNYSYYVCLICGTIKINWSRTTARSHVKFSEVFNIWHPQAIAAIVKYANFMNKDYSSYLPYVQQQQGTKMDDIDEEVQRNPDTHYTYYMVEYRNCLEGLGDYIVCETMEDVACAVKMAEGDFDDPQGDAQVTIRGFGLTPKQYAQYLIDEECPSDLDILPIAESRRDATIAFCEWKDKNCLESLCKKYWLVFLEDECEDYVKATSYQELYSIWQNTLVS